MLAGNVDVTVSGGTLYITGDDAGNGIAIQQLDTNRYAVIGFDVNGVATRINGSPAAKAFGGVTNDINIDTNGGPDLVVIGNKANVNQLLANEVSNNTAGTIGANPFAVNSATVSQSFVSIPQNLIINTDDGNDGVALQVRTGRPNHGGFVDVQTFDGNDRIALQVVSAEDDVLVLPGSGDDQVRMNTVAAYDFIFADLSSGNDSLVANNIRAGHSHLLGGDGNDSIAVTNAKIDRELLLTGDAGNDNIRLNSSYAQNLTLTTSSGNDQVSVSGFRASNSAVIDTGADRDLVGVDTLEVANNLVIALGSGNDRLSGTGSRARTSTLDGGSDFDTLTDGGGNALNANVVNFESVA